MKDILSSPLIMQHITNGNKPLSNQSHSAVTMCWMIDCEFDEMSSDWQGSLLGVFWDKF